MTELMIVADRTTATQVISDESVTSADVGRIELAAALRWAARLGMNEGIQNHFTLAITGEDDLYLVNPHDTYWSEICARDLVVVNGDGDIQAGNRPVERTAVAIHGAVHRARPSAKCVLHTHMRYATSLCMLEGWRLEYAHQSACRFFGRVAYDDEFQGLAEHESEGERIARALGDKDILFLANHGVIVTGPSVADAFDDLYYLEKLAELQVIAMSTGRRLRSLDEGIVASTSKQLMHAKPKAARHLLAALKQVLIRDEPDFANL